MMLSSRLKMLSSVTTSPRRFWSAMRAAGRSRIGGGTAPLGSSTAVTDLGIGILDDGIGDIGPLPG